MVWSKRKTITTSGSAEMLTFNSSPNNMKIKLDKVRKENFFVLEKIEKIANGSESKSCMSV